MTTVNRRNDRESGSMFFREWDLVECRKSKGKKSPAPHQKAALKKLHEWYGGLSEGQSGGILALPTGAGKTFTAIHFLCRGPLSDDYKILWLAHTHHLLEQAFFSFEPELLGTISEPRRKLRLRVVSGIQGHFPPRDISATDDVLVATLQTVTTAFREGLPQLKRFISSADGKLFVVFDEAHHAPAPSYRKLLVALQEAGAPVLGLTATPTYSDEAKRGWLKKLFPQGILAQARVPELMAQGVLAHPNFERTPTSVVPEFDEREYQKWLGTYRDIPEDVIDQLAANAERNAFIAKTYADGRKRWGKTIIFTDRWFQCEAIVGGLEKRGVKAGAVYSHIDAQPASVEGRRRRDRDDNAKELARFRRGDIEVLVNVRMLTEGTDLPDAKTVFLTRQTTSQILLTQMIGRALRGPKFGGTPEAYIVSFVDDWRQAIHWAEHDPLVEGRADEAEPRTFKRPPLHLISIELVKRLARQLDTGVNVTPGPFVGQMPIGWYRVTFDACPPGTDEVESKDQLVMVFDDEREGFERLIRRLLKAVPLEFESESAAFDDVEEILGRWRAQDLPHVARAPGYLLRDIFDVARHIAQGHGAPEFFPFEVREAHDLDALADRFIAEDLGPRTIQEALLAEFAREDRFWRTLYPRFDLFRSQYDGCQARLLDGSGPGSPCPRPLSVEVPSASEPDEGVKEQVKRRDGDRCLACGTTRKLQVDHVVPVSVGGSNDPENLQTLCGQCNRAKRKRTMRFKNSRSPLERPPQQLAEADVPYGLHAGDRTYWERFFRRMLNFTYECGAVSKVSIAGRGSGYYHWAIELMDGNPPAWIEPFLAELVERIQAARERAGKPRVESLEIRAPGQEAVRWPAKRRVKKPSVKKVVA